MLSEKQEESVKKMPAIDVKITMSKDGKFVLHKTTITDIKPLKYYQRVFENPDKELESLSEV